MLEAVNTVLQAAPLTKGYVEQASTAESFAANPDRVQKVAQAPYVSPYVYVDVNYNKAILQLRDGETGDVVQSFPSDTTLELRARDEARRAQILQESQVRQKTPDSGEGAQNLQSAPAPAPAQGEPAKPVSSNTSRQIAAFVSAAFAGEKGGSSSVTVLA